MKKCILRTNLWIAEYFRYRICAIDNNAVVKRERDAKAVLKCFHSSLSFAIVISDIKLTPRWIMGLFLRSLNVNGPPTPNDAGIVCATCGRLVRHDVNASGPFIRSAVVTKNDEYKCENRIRSNWECVLTFVDLFGGEDGRDERLNHVVIVHVTRVRHRCRRRWRRRMLCTVVFLVLFTHQHHRCILWDVYNEEKNFSCLITMSMSWWVYICVHLWSDDRLDLQLLLPFSFLPFTC